MAEDNRTFGLRKEPISVSPVLAGLEGDVSVPNPLFTLDVLGFVIEGYREGYRDSTEGVLDEVLTISLFCASTF
jgi:hypothetical protein